MNKMLMVGTGVGNTPILGGKGTKSFNQLVKALFANGEKGFAYDPRDMTTMSSDAAGYWPLTNVGQDVGMMLDKSKGLVLGVELLTNFNSTLSATLSSDTVPCVVTSTTDFGVYGAVGGVIIQPGTYKIEFSWEGNTNLAEMLLILPDGNSSISVGNEAAGTFSRVMRFGAAGSFAVVKAQPKTGQTFTITKASIKQLPSNTAFQSTYSMRPRLQDAPRRVAFDRVNAKLTTTLAAQLTGCTVIRAVPTTGIEIKTNQTIPANYEHSSNHCGLIVINRALTTNEVNQLTELFNKLAK